jgi:hypothetical protein
MPQYNMHTHIKPFVKKVKVTLEQATKAQRGSRGIALLSLTPALDEGGWSTPRPGRFTPGKETWYPLYRRLGGPQGRSGRVQKLSPPPGFDPWTVQPVASRYTDYAIPKVFRYMTEEPEMCTDSVILHRDQVTLPERVAVQAAPSR